MINKVLSLRVDRVHARMHTKRAREGEKESANVEIIIRVASVHESAASQGCPLSQQHVGPLMQAKKLVHH